MEYIAFDSHRKYTQVRVDPVNHGDVRELRVTHERGALRDFLATCEKGSPVAVETIGSWYWIIDEIEAAGMEPKLVHARKAKIMMGMINKTDKLDARGLNVLQRNGTLPIVWIPPSDVRDRRELPRTRMVLVRQRTQLKNRIHSTLAKFGLRVEGGPDAFAQKCRVELETLLGRLPPSTSFSALRTLEHFERLDQQVRLFETQMDETFSSTSDTALLRTIPGIGPILSVVVSTEVGDITRFAGPDRLASYSGTTPRVHSSGGKTRYGRLRSDVNRYLKWAFIEAANGVCMRQKAWSARHVVKLYARIRHRKGHSKAVGAVARHLAEATYWVLTKKVPYREPSFRAVSSTGS